MYICTLVISVSSWVCIKYYCIHTCFTLYEGELIRLPCSLKFSVAVNLSQNKPTFTLPFPVSGTKSMQLFIHPYFTGDLLRNEGLLKCFLHAWRTLIHCCLAIPDFSFNLMWSSVGALVLHTKVMASQFEGRFWSTEGAALKICCSVVTFRPKRNHNRLSCSSFNLSTFCRCAYWKCILWFGSVLFFFLAAVSVVFICEVLRVKVIFTASILTCDWSVQKQYGCKYFV